MFCFKTPLWATGKSSIIIIENTAIKIIQFSTQMFLFADAVVLPILFHPDPGLIQLFSQLDFKYYNPPLNLLHFFLLKMAKCSGLFYFVP